MILLHHPKSARTGILCVNFVRACSSVEGTANLLTIIALLAAFLVGVAVGSARRIRWHRNLSALVSSAYSALTIVPSFIYFILVYIVGILVVFLGLREFVQVEDTPAEQVEFFDLFIKACGALGLVLGSFFTWRTLRNAHDTLSVTQQGQITSRFTNAINQLGASNAHHPSGKAIEMRLGGIYALERIAWESREDHWQIMEVLTSYLRSNSPSSTLTQCQTRCRSTEKSKQEPDIQAIVRVIARRKHIEFERALDLRINLSGIDFSNIDFTGTNLQGALMNDSQFCGATFAKVDMRNAEAARSCFRNAKVIDHTDIGGVNFLRSIMVDINLSPDIRGDDTAALPEDMTRKLAILRSNPSSEGQ